MSINQLNKFLDELKKNKVLYSEVTKVATANEIASLAKKYGFEFTGRELKSLSGNSHNGVKIKKQDTTPSYNFGESGN